MTGKIHGVTGLVVPPQSGTYFEETMQMLASASAISAEMGTAEEERYHALFTQITMSITYEAVYLRLMP